MATLIDIDTQGEYLYVVRLRDDEEVTESWFTVAPGGLDDVRSEGEAEEDVVRRTAEFLLRRQGVADFPSIVDLDDVIATYGDDDDFLRP
jgi:hypothetical protein